jgi:hypothetical protein
MASVKKIRQVAEAWTRYEDYLAQFMGWYALDLLDDAERDGLSERETAAIIRQMLEEYIPSTVDDASSEFWRQAGL